MLFSFPFAYIITFPSYSGPDRISGAMYAGVPIVDFGLECNTDDYRKQTNNVIA